MQRTACERVKRFAERVAPVAQTTHPSQAGLARVLNSLVVPPFLRRGNLWGSPWVVNLYVVAVMITTREPLAPIVATHFISRHNYPTNVCYSS